MAPRLRQEPYNPNAVDADNDGIVQEGTAFERPAATNIVDEFGKLITEGLQSMSRGSGWRVVDSDGNDVKYKPTYAGEAASDLARPPRSNLGSTLGESRGNLGEANGRLLESTGGTLGQRIGTLGDQQKPDVPERTGVPDVVPDTQGGPTDVVPGSTAKGQAFRQRLTEAGGFDITDSNSDGYKAYAQDLKDRGVLGALYRPARSRQEQSEHFEELTDGIKKHVDKELADPNLPEKQRARFVELKRRLDSGESVEDLAKETARKHRAELDDEDTQVRIDFSAGILDDIIGSGGLVSSADDKAQDISSEGGQGSVRNRHEAALGIPPSMSSEGRPVSGYLVSGSMHRSRTDEGVQSSGFNPDLGDADQDEAVRRVNMIGTYGDAYVVLKKDSIRDRSATGHGDAPNYASAFGKTFDGTEDDSINTLFNDVGSTMRGSNGSASRTADTLAWGVSDEGFEGLVRGKGGTESGTMKKGQQNFDSYAETFITGGVGLEDIAEISLPAGMDEPFAKVTGKKFDGVSSIDVSGVSDDARRSGIQEILMDDSVTQFLTPEETSQLRELIAGGISDDVWQQIKSTNTATSLTHMRRLQKREEIRQRLAEKGFDGKVTFGFSDPPGLDLENPNNPAFASVAGRNPETGFDALGMITADRIRGILP